MSNAPTMKVTEGRGNVDGELDEFAPTQWDLVLQMVFQELPHVPLCPRSLVNKEWGKLRGATGLFRDRHHGQEVGVSIGHQGETVLQELCPLDGWCRIWSYHIIPIVISLMASNYPQKKEPKLT